MQPSASLIKSPLEHPDMTAMPLKTQPGGKNESISLKFVSSPGIKRSTNSTTIPQLGMLNPDILHLLARIRHSNTLEKVTKTPELASTRWPSLTPSDP
jgi:hypothetical protein